MGKRKNKTSYKSYIKAIIIIILASIASYFGITIEFEDANEYKPVSAQVEENKIVNTATNSVENVAVPNILVNADKVDLKDIPEYKDSPYVVINDNKPNFKDEDKTKDAFEYYSDLDSLGRCGVTFANICRKTMPPEGDTRGDISAVKPSGWKQAKHNGEFLYNRCHLIGYQLSDEDDNVKNLITGTRYFNVTGMLPFENQVAEHVKYQKKSEDKHVLYRVTPIYDGNNLVAHGVQMEAYSVEDEGQSVCYNVFVYNVQPGIEIDYATGASKAIN